MKTHAGISYARLESKNNQLVITTVYDWPVLPTAEKSNRYHVTTDSAQ